MDEKKDAPAVVRRRRKIARMEREQTPDAAVGNFKCSDEEQSNTNADLKPPPTPPTRKLLPTNQSDHRIAGGHLSKILSRRDRKITSNVRSLSSPRDEINAINKKSEVFHLMKQAKRSLSSPRHKEESSESGRSLSPQKLTENIKSPSRTIPNQAVTQFDKNILRFEEERRRFIQEKKRFEHEKRELDAMRKRRLDQLDKKPINIINSVSNIESIKTKTVLPQQPSELRNVENENIDTHNSSQIQQNKIDIPRRSSKPSDYESSTASCTTDEEDEIDHIIINSDSDENVEKRKEAKIEIVNKWVEETQAQMFDENGDPKIVVENLVESIKENIIDPNVELANPNSDCNNIVMTKVEIKTEDIIENTCENTCVNKIETFNENATKINNSFLKSLYIDSGTTWKSIKKDYPVEIEYFQLQRNKCISDFVILALYCGFGGMIFRFTEGSFENMYKCGVRRVKRDFVDQLWLSSHNLKEDDWKSLARTRLRSFEEELQTALEAGVRSYSGQKSWNFINSVIYCMTVVTTIGYGHISPSTTTGRAITILYAIIGIPLFLILLADFGKLFTRGIKFLWAFVRRVYYTGSCKKVRKTVQVQEVMRGINMVYDIATFRRPSMIAREEAEQSDKPGLSAPLAQMPPLSPQSPQSLASTLQAPSNCESPTTPAPEVFEIDDEFNLPISVACIILVGYIIVGAIAYSIWEDWSFFESFYFVFISMSTIGFGDYVPQHPIYMMASIIYLVFGLALTSMCINVVQVKLSDHFRQASAKIGATIGLKMAEEEAAKNSQAHTPVELASVHSSTPKVVETHPTFEFSTAPKMQTQASMESTNSNNEKKKKDRKIFKMKKSKK